MGHAWFTTLSWQGPRVGRVSSSRTTASAAGARIRPVWNALIDVVPELAGGRAGSGGPADAALDVLDCGGGSGSLAVPIAALGSRVTVVDSSADALAILSQRAEEAGVLDRVVAVQGYIEQLGQAIQANTYDVVLLHGLLDSTATSDMTIESLSEIISALAARSATGRCREFDRRQSGCLGARACHGW